MEKQQNQKIPSGRNIDIDKMSPTTSSSMIATSPNFTNPGSLTHKSAGCINDNSGQSGKFSETRYNDFDCKMKTSTGY